MLHYTNMIQIYYFNTYFENGNASFIHNTHSFLFNIFYYRKAKGIQARSNLEKNMLFTILGSKFGEGGFTILPEVTSDKSSPKSLHGTHKHRCHTRSQVRANENTTTTACSFCSRQWLVLQRGGQWEHGRENS